MTADDIHIIRTNESHPGFINLVELLDADLKISDGVDHDFYQQYNKPKMPYVVLVFDDDVPAACGAIVPIDAETFEVKRMYTKPIFRRMGLAKKVLLELEAWASELSVKFLKLETGLKQPAAIAFYQAINYTRIDNYGPYVGVENSWCFGRVISAPLDDQKC